MIIHSGCMTAQLDFARLDFDAMKKCARVPYEEEKKKKTEDDDEEERLNAIRCIKMLDVCFY